MRFPLAAITYALTQTTTGAVRGLEEKVTVAHFTIVQRESSTWVVFFFSRQRSRRRTIAWLLARTAISSLIIAARKAKQLDDNIRAVDLQLSEDDVRLLDAVSDPGIPYPKWMVLQLDTAEDSRSKVLYPEHYKKAVSGRTFAGQGGPGEMVRQCVR